MLCKMCRKRPSVDDSGICRPCQKDCENVLMAVAKTGPIEAVGMLLSSHHFIVIGYFSPAVPESLLRRDDFLFSTTPKIRVEGQPPVCAVVFGPEGIPKDQMLTLITTLENS